MKTKTLIISGVVIVLGGLIILLVISIGNRVTTNKNLVEIPGYPLEYAARVLSVEDDGKGGVVVTNIIDKYQVTLTKDWLIPETANRGGGVEFVYIPNDILRINIVALEATIDISFDEWMSKSTFFSNLEPQKIETTEGVLYRASGGLYEDISSSEQVLIKNSAVVTYALNEGNRFYVVSCVALGDNATELVSKCDRQAQSFRVIDKGPLSKYVPFIGNGFNIERTGINENNGDAKYTITIKPKSNPGDDGFKKEIEAIVESVNNWIESKGINPEELSIEWVTE